MQDATIASDHDVSIVSVFHLQEIGDQTVPNQRIYKIFLLSLGSE